MKTPSKIDIEQIINSTHQMRGNSFVSDREFKDRLEFDLKYLSSISSVKAFVLAKENLNKRFLFDHDIFDRFLDYHLYRICLEILIGCSIKYPKQIKNAVRLFEDEELAKEVLFITFQMEKGNELHLDEVYKSLYPEEKENIKTHRIFTRKIDGGFIVDFTRKQFFLFEFFLLLLLSPIVFYIVYFYGVSIITYMIAIPLALFILFVLTLPLWGLLLK